MEDRVIDRALKKARDKGMNQSQFARAMDVSPQVVTNWLRRDMPADSHAKAAEVLDCSVDELLGRKTGARRLPLGGIDPPSPGPDTFRLLPVVSHVPGGDFDEAFDPYAPGVAEEYLPSPRKVSEDAYWLRVAGLSMKNPDGEPSFPPDSLICVEPANRSPPSGTPVIAKLAIEHKVTFKVFIDEDGERWLKPLNPDYKPIRVPFEILGSVIGKWEDWNGKRL